MDANFLTWINATYPPGRADVLNASMESLFVFYGDLYTHWQSDLMSNLGYQDTYSTQAVVESDTLKFQLEALSRFGVSLDPEQINPEITHRLDQIIRGLLNADQYQIPHALLSCLTDEESRSEQLANVIAEVMGTTADDYMFLISDVTPNLIAQLKELMERLVEQQLEDVQPETVISESTELRTRVFSFIQSWDSSNPIIDYIEAQGKLGLEPEYYIKLWSVWLGSVALDFEKNSAKAWICIAMLTKWWDLPNAELVKAIEPWFSSIYGNVLRILKVRNALIKHLNELRP